MNRRWALLGLLGFGMIGRAEAAKKTMTIEGREFDIIRVEPDGSSYTIYGRRKVTEGYIYADVKIRLVRK